MKKTILTYGLIAGLIVSCIMAIILAIVDQNANFENSMWLGYASMLIAFSMIFVGTKTYRDKYNGGLISFGKAFKIGILITLIASTVYVLVWLVEEYYFFPDFIDKYTAGEIAKLASSGLTPAELADKTKDLEQAKEWYRNPLWKVLFTYMEILPVGLIVTLLSSLILKRQTAKLN